MKELLKNKQLLLLISAASMLTFLVIIIVIILIFKSTSLIQQSQPQPTTITPAPSIRSGNNENDIQQSAEYRKSFEEYTKELQPTIKIDREIGKLLNKLPHIGKNFRMDYSYSQNQFTVTINNTNRNTGMTEFNQFLLSNNIKEQSWIKNLQIVYE